jgi:phage terminase large subunit GpA-like protein
VIALKGSSSKGRPVIGRPTTVDINHKGRTIKGGVQLWMVGTDTAKSLLFNYLASDEEAVPEDRFIHFPNGLSEDYFEQLTAEVYDPKKDIWRKLHGRRNEVVDLFVYCFAAAFHPLLQIDRLRDADWTRLESMVEPANGDLFQAPATTEAVVQTSAPATTELQPAPQPPAADPAPAAVSGDGWLDGTDNWL